MRSPLRRTLATAAATLAAAFVAATVGTAVAATPATAATAATTTATAATTAVTDAAPTTSRPVDEVTPGVPTTSRPVTPTGPAVTHQGPEFGTQFHGMWSDYDDAQRVRVLDTLVAAGATWVRIDLGWSMLQPTSADAYDPWGVSFADRVIGMATTRGLKPLVTLWLTPAWANGDRGLHTAPTDPADYARVARWAAQRWAGKVAAWEVWNEASSPDYFTGADPVTYTRLLRAAYPAFKAGDPRAVVVFSGTVYNDDRWIARAYAAGAKGSFDVMATHPYMGQADAEPERTDPGKIWTLRNAAAVRALMVAQGDGDKPLWFTEFGWSTHANTAETPVWARGVSRETQADFAVRAMRLIAAEMPYVTNVFWYTDHDRTRMGEHAGQFGLLDRQLTPKPALTALAAHLATRRTPATTAAPAPTAPRLVQAPATSTVRPAARPTVRPAGRPSVKPASRPAPPAKARTAPRRAARR